MADRFLCPSSPPRHSHKENNRGLNGLSFEEKIEIIRDRWSDVESNQCEKCMEYLFKNYVANIPTQCENNPNSDSGSDNSYHGSDTDKSDDDPGVPLSHPSRYDGNVYAYAKDDIEILLGKWYHSANDIILCTLSGYK